MPFDVPSFTTGSPTGGGAAPFNLGGALIGLGQQLGSQFIQTRFAQTPTGGGSGQDGMGEILDIGTSVSMEVTGSSCGTCGPRKPCRCKMPEFILQAGDPCYPRRTTRTMLVNGCKVQQVVYAPARKKPRMNPLNIRAARRSTRRLVGMGRALKGARKAVNLAARQLK